jgi:hypothetical protein
LPLSTNNTNSTVNLNTHPALHNDVNAQVNVNTVQLGTVQSDIATIEGQLGTDPAGVFANVEERLNVMDFSKGSNGVGAVIHGATAGQARPTGFLVVIWIGTVTPTNMAASDLFFDLTP